MAIQILSFQQILGGMLRKIISETALNDLNAGSVLLTLLEAAAAQDFENNTAILNVLELLNIDSIKNNDLDVKAGDYGLERRTAIKASGLVNILNTNIVKRSTGLYIIKPTPIAGQTKLYVNSTSGWDISGGTLYIGRGTQSFEGPITYSSITVFPTYSQINLSSALQKDHLSSDIVIDSQGQPDRLITAGTIVKIPANNQNPEVQYITLRDSVIPSGETVATGVEVIAFIAGSLGNAGINTITGFDTTPFAGASVTNTSSFSNGKDIETDTELRNRLKSYSVTLARGTAPSIIESILGVSDPDDSNQVASAVITEPVKVGDPSILYVDTGDGFQPSFAGQSVDTLLTNATGKEEFLQLSNYPVPRPQVINTDSGPYTLKNGSFLRITVDSIEETIYFNTSDFINISSATLSEVVVAINAQSTLFKARFTNTSSNILLYPVAHNAELIQVTPLRNTDDLTLYANTLLKFPTDEFSYISLYQNANRLHEKAKSGVLETTAYAQWNIIVTSNILIEVDGTPAQDHSFALSDFAGASSFTTLTLNDWVTVFNNKFAGLTAVATPSQTMVITSNKVGASSEVTISGGTLINKWFPNLATTNSGQTAQFELNRQTGNLRILTGISAGDNISAGIEDAKGYVVSTTTSSGTFNFSSDAVGRPAEMVVVADSAYCNQVSVPLIVGATISITNPSASTMRIMSSTIDTFVSLMPGDFLYITARNTWVSTANSGLFKIKAKGQHTTVSGDTFVDVDNIGVVTEAGIVVADSLDIKGFSTDGLPQIWRGTYLVNPPVEPMTGVIASLNKDLIGVLASTLKSNSIKLTSTTEHGGSIAIPVSTGNASITFVETKVAQFGNSPHIASRTSNKSLISMFKRSIVTDTNVFLDRHTYTDSKGSLTANTIPDSSPFSGTYSETVQSTGQLTTSNVSFDDYLSFTRGNNRDHFKSIKAKIATDQVGTQQGTAHTELDHVIGEEIELIRPLSISSEDSIVVVLDKDPVIKTVDVRMSRTGRVNSGSGVGSFIPTSTEFSALDQDNEPGTDFNNLTVWSTNINNTDFSDYAVWMRARNWYSTGGVGNSGGKMLVRSQQYGPNGEKLRFAISYPTSVDQLPSTTFLNSPSWSLYSYFFGSGSARATAISTGYTVGVKGPYIDAVTNFPNGTVGSGNFFDYTFSAGNFAPIQVGDVISISSGSGLSTTNRGQFRVEAKSGLTIRVANPLASITSPGLQETTTVTTIADIVGTPTVYTIDTVADVANSLHQKYFTIYDSQGSVAVWYDVGNTGAVAPVAGTNRYIKVASVLTNDTAVDVATKTSQTLTLDNAFNINDISNQVTITNIINGNLSAATTNTSGFTVATTAGTSDVSIDGKYFIIYDEVGSVAVWYDVGNDGTPEPFHGANRSIKVSGVNYGNSATIIAAATVAAINPDLSFSASNLSNVVTIINTTNGNMPTGVVGTSGFSMSSTDGSLSSAELITNAGNIVVFPLVGSDVQTIADTVNAETILEITPVGNPTLTIPLSTEQEFYIYGGDATALGFGHNPTTLATRNHINLYDGINWVKAFANTNPNFTMKTAFTLNGVAPSIYQMDTSPNANTAELGEYIKLIPVSVKNIHHHLTQKALSQLPIVSNIHITNDRKNIQITSKQLGSAGAIEIVGGNANKAQTYIYGESEVAYDTSGNYLLMKVPAFPDTFNVNDYIKIENDIGVKRFNRLLTSDSITVTNPSTNIVEYNFNPKAIGATSSTAFTITDVSGAHGRPAGFVWRWTHDGSVTLAQVRAGDQVFAFGNTLSWAQGNKVRNGGDGLVAGLPIIMVNDTSNYFDVVNPYGKIMSSTTIGAGNSVQICPTPIIKWNLGHANYIKTSTVTRTSNIVTVICSAAHFMNSGDSVDIRDSINIVDGSYSPITVINSSTFTFASVGVDFTEPSSGANVIKTGLVPTRYRIEKLGFNSMVRLSRQDGVSPRFADSGVAVDDYIIISGETFKTNNNGRFRVLAVDNDSVIFNNVSASDELSTVVPFNNNDYFATWTANTNIVTGVAGTFKNLSIGDWVKKPEDQDTAYRQVLAFSPSTASTATQITIGGVYSGTTAIAAGISYNMLTNYDKGIYLKGQDDIVCLEGDAATIDDTLFIQNIVNSSWFNSNNIGSFPVIEVGTNTSTFTPFIRVNNPIGIPESGRLLSVDSSGLYLVEGLINKFSTIRKIENIAIDDLNSERRAVYITPSNRGYKFSDANATSITSVGKLGYSSDVTIGVDGYLYYTGLLRRVQRIVDGYEPDATNFPGRRAVGGAIESLPPLIRKIIISINITTNEGVNLGDISNNIKSTIINYIKTLNVGEDVILSEIIASIMSIKGVGAVTFSNPVPSTERITIANNERAIIDANDIGIS